MTACAVAKNTHTHSCTQTPPLVQTPPVYSLYLNPPHLSLSFVLGGLLTWGCPSVRVDMDRTAGDNKSPVPTKSPPASCLFHPMTPASPLNFCHPIPRPSWDANCLPNNVTNKNTRLDITFPKPLFMWCKTSISHLHQFHLGVTDYAGLQRVWAPSPNVAYNPVLWMSGWLGSPRPACLRWTPQMRSNPLQPPSPANADRQTWNLETPASHQRSWKPVSSTSVEQSDCETAVFRNRLADNTQTVKDLQNRCWCCCWGTRKQAPV